MVSKNLLCVFVAIVFGYLIWELNDNNHDERNKWTWTTTTTIMTGKNRYFGSFIHGIFWHILGNVSQTIKLILKSKNDMTKEKENPESPFNDDDDDDYSHHHHHSELVVFSKKELAKFKGHVTEEKTGGDPKIYLSILGRVYDVSKGAKHYGPDGAYSFFSGIDASLAFVTGDFTKSGLTDDVELLNSEQLTELEKWVEFYNEEYKFIGYLSGRFYDRKGKPTEVLEKIHFRIKEFQDKQKLLEESENILPPCNTEWTERSFRVWCTRKSGGISREWSGVPRRYFKAGSSSSICVCVRNTQENSNKFKEYKGCDHLATSCNLLLK